MSITAESAEQIIKLLRSKVEAGTLDKKTAEHLAVVALQEVQTADEENVEDENIVPEDKEEDKEEVKPVSVIDPSAQILALISQFDQGTASLWTSVKSKIEDVLKGVQGAAFPLGDFSSNASTAAKGNKTKIAITKGDNNTSVDVNFVFSREWNIPGLNPPEVQASTQETACHLGLRRELLSLAQDISDMSDSKLVWARSRFPEKTIAYLSAESRKENDPRVVEALKALPKNQDREDWQKWSIAAQVFVLGNDYTGVKSFDDLALEISAKAMKAKIEMTPNITKMLKKVPKSAWEGILARAWDACNDGEFLAREYDFSYDPWDGKHEEMRKQVEEDCVSAIIEQGSTTPH